MTSYAKFRKRNSIFDRSLFFNENTINVFVFILKLKKEERKKPVSIFLFKIYSRSFLCWAIIHFQDLALLSLFPRDRKINVGKLD